MARQRLENALAARADTQARESLKSARADQFDQARAWTWTGWRDEVKGPGGRKTSMTKALSGRLDPLLRD